MKYPSRLFFLFALALVSCKSETKEAIRTEDIAFAKEGELSVLGPTDVKARFDIEFAESPYETQTGLMYRSSMERDQGMFFIFPDLRVHSFYMKNTEIPLDIIFIDGNLKVVSIQKNAKPYDEKGLSSQFPIKYVLEINAGLSDAWGLVVGDSISYTRN